jgi:uncharacterized integral membrane protein
LTTIASRQQAEQLCAGSAPALSLACLIGPKFGKEGAFSRLAWPRNNIKLEATQKELMKAMMLVKITVVTVIFLLLVLMGLHNRAPVDFNLPPLLSSQVEQPAALMYFAFFAVGLMTGAILCAGGSKEKSKSHKPS